MRSNIGLLIFLCLLALSCGEDVTTDPIIEEPMLVDIKGLIEKGPYLSGSSITISELTSSLRPSGRVFNTEIKSDNGLFTLDGVELESPYVTLHASGFYYDEILDDNSESQLSLRAISDIRKTSDINVNVITTLEKPRVEYLLGQGLGFEEAKAQAIEDVLAIFEIEENNATVPEGWSISQDGDTNAMLLAASVILQGYQPVADVSQLLSKISLDIAEDGILDDTELGDQLVFNATRLNLSEIRNNLEKRFAEVHAAGVAVPAFEPYVSNFLANTDFEYGSGIEYPDQGMYGHNLLSTSLTTATRGNYSMHAILPDGGKLRVRVTGNNWLYRIDQAGQGWTWGPYENFARTFESNEIGEIDFEIRLAGPQPQGPVHKSVLIEVFENDSEELSWSNEIVMTDVEAIIRYNDGLLSDHYHDSQPGEDVLDAYLCDGTSLEIKIVGEYWTMDDSQSNTGWTFSELNEEDNSRIFKTEEGIENPRILVDILNPPKDTIWDITPEGDSLIIHIEHDRIAAIMEVYENGSTQPTWTRDIRVIF